MLLRVLLIALLLLREEEVRLGGAIGLPKGGHGYCERLFRAAGSRRDVGSVLALARRVNQLSPALLLLGTGTITPAHAGRQGQYGIDSEDGEKVVL